MGSIKKMDDTIELYNILGKLDSPIQHIGGISATAELLEMLSLKKNEYILDVGCGGGYTACLIAEKYECRVEGIDASPVMIENARRRAEKRKLEDLVTFQLADVYQLPFKDNKFDCAFFESFLNVLPGDREAALAEIARVVQFGGRIGGNELVTTPDIPEEIQEEVNHLTPYLGNFMNPEELKALFQRAGLSSIIFHQYPASKISSNMLMGDSRKLMGISGLASYLVRMVVAYFRHIKLRSYSKYSRIVLKDKKTRKYFGYAFIVGQK
ncbi:MAG: class I SAM-dependent methyltransferase [Candidatus Heimdallarchaeota archaeon]|nr:class I SAM-dependent methyltransferase [Candidatus Heimdallarchaeota archaeon]